MQDIKFTKKQLLIFLTLVLAGVFLMGSFLLSSGVRRKVTVEVGNHDVELQDFIKGDISRYQLITKLEDINFDSTGEVPIQVKYKDKVYESRLLIVDTTAPVVQTKERAMILNDKEPEPKDFIEEVFDYSEVTVSYKREPDFAKTGEQEIYLVAEDEHGNRVETQSVLRIYDIKKAIDVELGQFPKIDKHSFLNGIHYDLDIITDISTIIGGPVGDYNVEVSIDGRILETSINIIDTTAPTANVKEVETFQNIAVEAAEFIYDVVDESDFTVEYKYEPDFSSLGVQEVSLLVIDQYKNTSEYKSTLNIKEDTEPPTIIGVRDIIAYLGKSISYRTGVEVKDNSNEDIDLIIDSSNVNPKEKGSYEVIYRATDRVGNTTEKRATVTVVGLIVSEEEFNGILDGILSKITDDQMSPKEKAYAIFKFSKNHIAYTGFSDKNDWKNEAYKGIKNAKGDCFTYFSVSKALLTRVGIDNLDVTRIGGQTEHYWNLINIDGNWYHFDTTRHVDKKEVFMFTDAELEEINKTRNNYYYKFDESLYPRTP